MGFRSCANIYLRVLEAIIAILTMAFAIFVIHLSQDLEALRQDDDTVLTNLLTAIDADKDVLNAINSFLEKALEVPDRIWFLFSVSIWTLIAISYKPAALKWFPACSGRAYVVPLEMLTLLLWLLGFILVVSLAVEIEPLCLALDHFPVLSKYLKICLYAKIAAASAAIGCALWTVTSIAACCSGRRKSAESRGSVENGREMQAGPHRYGRIGK